MGTEVNQIIIDKLNRQIAEIDARGRATKTDAVKVVAILIGSYREAVEDIWIDQLTTAITGQDPKLLDKFVDPKNGIIGKSKFLPTISECLDWFANEEKHFQDMRARFVGERDQLEERRKWVQDPPEVRQAMWEKWQQKRPDF